METSTVQNAGLDAAEQPRSRAVLKRRINVLDAALKPKHALRIVDIGANPINVPSYEDLLALGSCEVWGFEPDERAYGELMTSPKPGTHYMKAAVGRPGPGKFYPHPQSGLSSTFPVRQKSVQFYSKPGWFKPDAQAIDIDLVSLDSLSENALPKPDVIKIDIQGGELDVFCHGREKMDQAVCVIPEVRFYRIYEGEPLWGAVDQELHAQGFTFHKFEFTKTLAVTNSQADRLDRKAVRSQMLDGDAIYIRNPETMGDWSVEQVSALAYAASGVFFSHDLVVHALDELVRRSHIDGQVPARYVDSLPRWMRK
ncbi:MAG: FkbM family methyltransferase [Sedimentitalea sp.]